MKRSMTAGLLALVLAGLPLHGQVERYFELRPFGGAAAPTGSHRDAFDPAAIAGSELALRLTRAFDLVGYFAWQPMESKYVVADSRRADVWVFNVGIERGFRGSTPTPSAVVPFIGAGVGGRAFDFRSASLAGTTCYSGYGSGGVAYEVRGSSVRLEVRDNLFCYKSPVVPFDEQTRNEVNILAAIGIRF